MDLVIRNIEFLLSTHDCVIVPGFGAFLATWKSSNISANNEIFEAPRRQYAFNAELTESDGLLVNSVSKSLGISYNLAQKVISDFVVDLKTVLNQEGTFSIGRVGIFEVSMLGDLHFEPYKNDYFTPLNNWWNDLKLQRISQPHKINTNKIRPIRWQIFARTAVGALAALLIAIVVSTPVIVKDSFKASTIPSVTPPKVLEINEDGDKAQSISDFLEVQDLQQNNQEEILTTDAVLPSELESALENSNSPRSKEQPSETFTPVKFRFNYDDPYILVVASLVTREDAEKYILDYAFICDYPLGIEEMNGKYRIYAATGTSSNELYKIAKSPEITKYFKDAWVTRR